MSVSSSRTPAALAASALPLTIAFAGMAALASAMGIGRFAFTPLLPMMLHDGVVDLPQGSWLATANYLGYLLGALLYMVLPRLLGRAAGAHGLGLNAGLVRGGLVATAVFTAGMAAPWQAAWPTLRLLAGMTSALVFLGTVNWCLARLAQLKLPALGGLVFCGPGLGIALTGLAASAMVASQWSAAAGWGSFALLAVLLCLGVWRVFAQAPTPQAAAGAAPGAASELAAPHPAAQRTLLALAYGLSGLGYIVTATFLPVIARAALPPGSVWVDLFWPMFGAGVALGAWLTTYVSPTRDRRVLLALAYAIQALAIVLGLVWPTAWGFALGSVLLGLPFTAITFFALAEARHQWPQAGASFTGLLTALYGLGQIAGPPMVAALLARAPSQAQGFEWGLSLAASALLLGLLMFVWMVWRWPNGATK